MRVLFMLIVAMAASFSSAGAGPVPRGRDAASQSGPDDLSLADLQQVEAALRSQVERLRAATVSIRSGVGSGSGAIIRPDGLVLTAAHVVGRTGEWVMVALDDGRSLPARALGCDHDNDIALVKILAEGPFPAVELGQAPPAAGDWALALGHPGGRRAGRKAVLRAGRLVEDRSEEQGVPSLVSDAPLLNGDSGGPLFDMKGRLVGVHKAINPLLNENALHTSVRTVRKRLHDLLAREEFGQPLFLRAQRAEAATVKELENVFQEATRSPAAAAARNAADSDPAQSGSGKASASSSSPAKQIVKVLRIKPGEAQNIEEFAQELRKQLQKQSDAVVEHAEIAVLQTEPLRSAPPVRRAVAPVVSQARRSVVRLLRDGAPAALGVVVRADGLVVSKASELRHGRLQALVDHATVDASLLAVDDANDLALLRIDADGLTPLRWASEQTAAPGSFVVSPLETDEEDVAVGVVGHEPFALRPLREEVDPLSLVGASLERALGEAHIASVREGGPAAEAGLEPGEAVIALDSEPVANGAHLRWLLQRHASGDRVVLTTLTSQGRLRTVPLTLHNPDDGAADASSERDRIVRFVSKVAGSVSSRRDGFPRVFLHDAVLEATDVGGPVVDLAGRVVGLNIARVDRASTAAIPAAWAQAAIDALVRQMQQAD